MGALDPTISTVGHIGGFIGGLFTAAVLGILGDSMNPNFIIRSITLSVVTLFALIIVVSPPTKGVNQLCWQAHLQANAREYQSAIAILNQAQKAYPHQKKEIQLKIFQVETEWADRLYGLKNYREAIRHYTVIIKRYDPQSPKIYQNMATACQSLGETEEASFWYKKAKEAVSANSILGILQ
jgi:tetratricopeptide (TPR) repeat protein